MRWPHRMAGWHVCHKKGGRACDKIRTIGVHCMDNREWWWIRSLMPRCDWRQLLYAGDGNRVIELLLRKHSSLIGKPCLLETKNWKQPWLRVIPIEWQTCWATSLQSRRKQRARRKRTRKVYMSMVPTGVMSCRLGWMPVMPLPRWVTSVWDDCCLRWRASSSGSSFPFFLQGNAIKCYEAQASLHSALNHIFSSSLGNWLVPALHETCRNTRLTALAADAGQKDHAKLQGAVTLLQESFSKTLNDRTEYDPNAPLSQEGSKKAGVLYIVNQLFSMYFRLNTLRLCKNLVR
jgi:hypothetical protein